MDFESLLRGSTMGSVPGQDIPMVDTAETIQISSLALLKVGKIGRCKVYVCVYFCRC